MAENKNIHPMTGSFSNILSFFKGNILFAILSFFVLLGAILPPRGRKRRYGNHRRRNPARRRKSVNTANPGKRKRTKSGKKLPRSVNAPKKTKKQKVLSTARTMPARFIGAKKGTPLMDEKMNWLRSKR